MQISMKNHLSSFCPEQRLQNNGTLYAHVFITKRGKSPDPLHPKYNRLAVVNRTMCKYVLTLFNAPF